MAIIPVVAAFKTDHFPLDGNLAEEVLILNNGQAVYLNPDLPDQICASQEDALSMCIGHPTPSASLLTAWREGFMILED